MKNWRKDRNYRKRENADGSFTYIIGIDGVAVEVTEEIYSEYAKADRKMEYMENDLKRNRVLQGSDGKAVLGKNGLPVMLPEREISLDKLIDENWEFPSTAPTPEDIVFRQLEIETLRSFFKSLTSKERSLFIAIYLKGMTEREYSLKTGIAQKTINDRKRKIRDKVEITFKKF